MKKTLIGFVILITLWIAGFFQFFSNVNNFSSDNRNYTDAIVVFGGNKQRLYTGVQLLKLGYAPLIFITGDKPKQAYNNFFKLQKIASEQFIFDTKLASDKRNHAVDTANFLKKYKLQSIRIVADAAQMPRALRELQYNLPADVIIIANPVSRKHKLFKRTIKEYLKYQTTLIASFLGFEEHLDLDYS